MIPRAINEAWTIEGANWVQQVTTGMPVERTHREMSELEDAAHDDWLASGTTDADRRHAAFVAVKSRLKDIGAMGSSSEEALMEVVEALDPPATKCEQRHHVHVRLEKPLPDLCRLCAGQDDHDEEMP